MTTIKLSTDLGGNKTGDTIEVTEGSADLLINGNYAEAVDAPKAKPRGRTKSTPDQTDDTDGGGTSPDQDGITGG